MAYQLPFVAGIATVAATAAALPATDCTGVLLQADADNSGVTLIGDASNQVWELAAGDSLFLPCDKASRIYHKGTASDKLNYFIVTPPYGAGAPPAFSG